MSSVDDFTAGLTPSQIALLEKIRDLFKQPIYEEIEKKSDIVTASFAEEFRNHLVLHHALTEQLLSKKPFEYAFASASRAAGHYAAITANGTHPGCDVSVDGRPYSCKTEAAKNMNRDSITISKLMEARWIRDCASPSDYCSNARTRLTSHLAEYDRIVMLRAFRLDGDRAEYHLIEIPKDVLLLASKLSPNQFAEPTKNNSTSAEVHGQSGLAFRLILDGSVEKITVAKLNASLCRRHARWIVPLGLISHSFSESESCR